jgi:hypothetical protein
MGVILTILTFGLAVNGWATPITFYLDYVLEYGSIKEVPMSSLWPSYPSFGKITLDDNLKMVDVAVDLYGGSGVHKVEVVDLNYDDNNFSNSSNFNTVGSEDVKVNENGIKANGYNGGKFDLQIPKTGNLDWEPYTFTLKLDNGASNLDPGDFNFQDSGYAYYVAVHIGNFGGTPGVGGGDSIWVASSGRVTSGEDPIPEPATILLVGSGLVGLARIVRRKK